MTVSGGVFAGNTLAGILAGGGVLTVQGGASVSNNDTFGLHVAGATTTVTGADIHTNGLDGLYVSGGTGNDDHDRHGGRLAAGGHHPQQHAPRRPRRPRRRPPAAARTRWRWTRSLSHRTARTGLPGGQLRRRRGDDRGCTVSSNGAVGLRVEQGARQDDHQRDSVERHPQQQHRRLGHRGRRRPVRHVEHADQLHRQQDPLQQRRRAGLRGAAELGTTWTIGTNACNASANSIYCYGTGNVGIRMSAATGTVDARATRWASASPAAAVEYSTVGVSSEQRRVRVAQHPPVRNA